MLSMDSIGVFTKKYDHAHPCCFSKILTFSLIAVKLQIQSSYSVA